MSTRVLVVDDSLLFRRVVTEALSGIPGVEVAGSAPNGRLALSRLSTFKPDLLTLDIEMPEMGGIEVLESLRGTASKVAILVLSSQTKKGGELTVRALELGALDFVTKPEGGTAEENLLSLRKQLLPILLAFERKKEIRSIPSNPILLESRRRIQPPELRRHPNRPVVEPIVLIGVSTGGPAALAAVLPALPADFPAPVFVTQHMPALFTEALASSLDSKCKLRVCEAQNGQIAEQGWVYIAPGGRHMKLGPGSKSEADQRIQIHITDDPPENNCRPSVDALFKSAAQHFPGRSISLVLTGMGADGAEGLRMLKRGGCYSIAQDEASCVVFGMPREAILTGLVDLVAPLAEIPAAIEHGVSQALRQVAGQIVRKASQ